MTHELAGRRILIVEDEFLVGISAHDSLEDAGATVIGPIGNVDDAMHVLDSCDVDAVILDINLSGTEAYPVADRLAAQQVPFVFASGYDRKFLPARFSERPMLQKPYDDYALREALSALIES